MPARLKPTLSSDGTNLTMQVAVGYTASIPLSSIGPTYGTGVAAALAINVGAVGGIVVKDGDIGTATGTQLTLSSNFYVGSTGTIFWTNRGGLLSPANGVVRHTNALQTTGVCLDANTADTLTLKNSANNALGSLACANVLVGNGTAALPSLAIGATNSGFYTGDPSTSIRSVVNGNTYFGFGLGFVDVVGYMGLTTSSPGAGVSDVRWYRGSTGPTFDACAAGGFRSRDLANSADAPISCSVVRPSVGVAAGSGYLLTNGAALNYNAAGINLPLNKLIEFKSSGLDSVTDSTISRITGGGGIQVGTGTTANALGSLACKDATFANAAYPLGTVKIMQGDNTGSFAGTTTGQGIRFAYYLNGGDAGAIFADNSGGVRFQGVGGGYVSPGYGVTLQSAVNSYGVNVYAGTPGLIVRDRLNTADGPISCSNVTASRTVTATDFAATPVTFAGLPPASSKTGKSIQVSDRDYAIATSNGTNWLRAGTSTILT